ncbi:hypothetical protein Bca4012_009162 [Brassica carinata]
MVKVMENWRKEKKVKILKAVLKHMVGVDLEAGLVAEIQNKTISEAKWILFEQLDLLKTEEKLLKKRRKKKRKQS